MDKLGNTLEEIAFEKAGIIKGNGDVVLYPQSENIESIFVNTCNKMASRLHKVDFSSLVPTEYGLMDQVFDFSGYKQLRISMHGSHQLRNAAIAVRASELLMEKGYSISVEALRKGLSSARWPGRLEIVNERPYFLIDGAHNSEGARMLFEALDRYFPRRCITFIIGVLKDKDIRSMVEAVSPIAGRFIAVTPDSARAVPGWQLADILRDYCREVIISDTVDGAVRTSLSVSGPEDIICAFGSLYFIGEIRSCFEV
jgi:dihydrofolate synthase/folylpolyglutamate synthase